MKNFIFLILAVFGLFTVTAGAANPIAQSGVTNLLVDNSGFELGKTKWVSSGGAFSITSSTKLFGGYSASFQATAAGQYFESALYPVPTGMYGNSCLARAYFQGGDTNLAVSVLDQTGTVLTGIAGTGATVTLKASVQTNYVEIGFKCPASGSLKIRVSSTAASAVAYFDQMYLGSEDRFFKAAQTELMGTMTISGCAAGWSTTSTTLVDLAAQTSCVYAGTGSAAAPSTMIPGFTFASLPPGEYAVEAEGYMGGSSSSVTRMQFWDGTNTAREISALTNGNSNAVGFPSIKQTILYPAGATNVTLRPRMSVTGNTTYIYANTADRLVLRLYRYPTSSQSLYIQTQAPNDNTYLNDFTAYVSSSGVVSNENVDWINGNASVSGTSFYTMTFNSGFFTGTPNCLVSGGNNTNGQVLSTVASVSSSGVQVFMSGSPNGGAVALPFTIHCERGPTDFKNRAVIVGYLGNTVYSTTLSGERIERISFGGATEPSGCTTSPCTVYRQSGAISSVTRNSAGNYTLNFPAGTFSTTPTCTCTQVGLANQGFCSKQNGVQSSTIYGLLAVGFNGTALDGALDVICMGPK